MIKPEKGEQLVTDYKEHHTDTTVSFTVKMTENGCRKAHSVGLNKFFKMTTSITRRGDTQSKVTIEKYIISP